ncbi:unnamed protein product [Caenorhabditis auriculariae]|uniref:Protein kinase domain-containing protein n=1 Tax=Caenorhabditis auriculariae TaxID=2777116 RepID=A0A8S1HMS7_9PELO|nr:unnamed protein product [Caenorhabditis auriculariae]
MSKGALKLIHIKRSQSYNEIDGLEEPYIVQDQPPSGSGSRKGSFASIRQKKAPRAYTGRHSYGYVSKIKRKKSKTERDREYDYGDYENNDDDEGYVASPNSTYRCIPTLERSEHSSEACLSTTSSASRINSASTSNEAPESPTQSLFSKLAITDRKSLHNDLSHFMKKAEAKDAVQIGRRNVDCQRNGQSVRFTIGGKDAKKYKFENVLWLVLQAYFSGRDVCDGQDPWLAEDSKICKERQSKELILDEISEFSFEKICHLVQNDSNEDADKQARSKRMSITPDYSKNLVEAKKKVEQLLKEFDAYASLFPHSAAMWDDVVQRRGFAFRTTVDERVTALRTWINTLHDLNEKIESLGVLFEVATLNDGRSKWLKPLSEDNQVQNLDDAKHVFETYVKRSLNMKGMKRVLTRVEALIETTVVKSAILMQRPPKNYAAAAIASKSVLKLSETMKERFGEMAASSARFSLPLSRSLKLPHLEPLFFFVLGVPMQLVSQWLTIRSEAAQEYSQMDELTLEALMEDSRDCVEEAVRIKRNYVDMLQSMCHRCALPVFLYPIQFNNDVLDVFKKYVHYVRCWCACDAVVNNDPSRLFMRLENEWNAALTCARFIRSGVDTLCSTICDIITTLLEKIVVDYAEDKTDEIKLSFLDTDSSDDDEGRGTVFSCRSTKIMDTKRTCFMTSIYQLVREIKERECRILCFFRSAVQELHDAVGCDTADGVEILKAVNCLSPDHCLIDLESDDAMADGDAVYLAVTLFVDTATADRAGVEECLLAMSEGRHIEGDSHIIVVPDMSHKIRNEWAGRKVKVTIDEEKRICYTYLRRDAVCVLGDYDLTGKHASYFKTIAPSCSSNDLIDKRLQGLVGDTLIPHLDFIHKWVDIYFDKLNNAQTVAFFNSKLTALFITMDQEFLIGYQLHRDVSRLVSDAYMWIYGKVVLERSLKLVSMWTDFVSRKNMQPTHSVPMWAVPAFTFMQTLSECKWTSPEIMTDEQYAEFSRCFNECRNRLVARNRDSVSFLTGSKQVKTKYRSRASLSKPSSPITGAPKTRVQCQKEAAEELDRVIEEKQKDALRLGRVLNQKNHKFRLSTETTEVHRKKATFEWVLNELIAAGSFGKVYRAFTFEASGRRRLVAAKMIPAQRNVIKFIEAEIDILRTLQHPNLVKYYDFEVGETDVVIFMELCSEGTLERICREGMDLKLVRRYTNSLLNAVQYLHDMKIVHRDIKPANVFLDRHCVLKLGDFGCSSRLADTHTVFGEFNEFIGTPQYMAPEVFSNGNAREDGRYQGYGRMADIWSVGCVVLQMLTGHVPWPGMDKYQMTWQMCEKKLKPTFPSIASNRKDVAEFLDMCFVYDPRERPGADVLLQTPFANVSVKQDHEDTDSSTDHFEIIRFPPTQ